MRRGFLPLDPVAPQDALDAGAGGDPLANGAEADPVRRAVLRLVEAVHAEAAKLRASVPRLRFEAARIPLAGASEDARAVADLLAAVAAGTFSAALCAIRAGASVRGFAGVARETRALAEVLESSFAILDDQICGLEERCAEAAAIATRLEHASDGVAQAGDLAAGGTQQALAAQNACLALAEAIEALADTLAEAIGAGDRRQSLRVAVDLPCVLLLHDGVRSGRIVDLSRHGARLVLDDAAALPPGRPVRLALAEIPRIVGSVVAGEEHGTRIAFDLRHEANAAAREPLTRLIASVGAAERALIVR